MRRGRQLADECTECGACVAECPTDAIALDTRASPEDIERNAAFFRRR